MSKGTEQVEKDDLELEEGGQATTGTTGQDGGEAGQAASTTGSAATAETKEEKTFTQAQVNRMMTREKNQGRNAVYNELGIDPKNAAQIAAVKAYLDSQKTDDEKAAEAQAAHDKALSDAQERAAIAEIKAEAMMLGVQKQYVEDVTTLAMAKMAAVEDADLKTVIGELKTKYPIWFGETKEDNDDKGKKAATTGQRGTGSSVKSTEKKEAETKGLGARLAASRRAGGQKSTYWGNTQKK